MSDAAAARPTRSTLARQRRRRRLYGALVRLLRALFPSSAPARLRADDVRRMLVVRDDRIGDLIVTTPLIDFLREIAPHAEVDVVCSPVNAEVLAGDSRVSRVFVNDRSLAGRMRLVLALRRRAYDVTFSVKPGSGPSEGLFACFITRPHAARVSIWRPKRYHGYFTHVVRSPFSLAPMPDQVAYTGLAVFAGVRAKRTTDYPIRMHIPDRSAQTVTDYLARAGIRDFVAVNLWAAEPWRVWPPEQCASTLQRIVASHEALHFVLTPPPGRGSDADEVLKALGSARVHAFPSEARIVDRAALIARARLVITCNTAIVPMASAFGRPVVGLYSNKRADRNERYLPRDVPQKIVYASPDGSVADIPPESVAQAFDSLISAVR